MRLSGIVKQSVVDGPGLRFVVFVQGCPHNCFGCHNPESLDFNGGYECNTEELLVEYDKNPLLKGITLSGGEPFSQAAELVPLAQAIRERGKDIWCFSGYSFEELMGLSLGNKGAARLLVLINVLVDGRFIFDDRSLSLKFRGSSNQRVLHVARSLERGKAMEFLLD